MGWGTPKAYDDPSWRERGKVWVEVVPGRKRLVDLNKPRPDPNRNRSTFPAPAIHSDQLSEPLQSMATGTWHDSKSSLLKTYRADGNPQGVNYEVVGDAPIEPYTTPAPTREQEEDTDRAISRALDEMGF